MAETLTNRSVSGVAIASVVLGILTLLMFWIPIVHLLPGLLAIVLGVIGLRMARRGTAGGAGLSVVGIICAVLGMLPTMLLMLAFIGIGATSGDVEFEFSEQPAAAAADESPSTTTTPVEHQ